MTPYMLPRFATDLPFRLTPVDRVGVPTLPPTGSHAAHLQRGEHQRTQCLRRAEKLRALGHCWRIPSVIAHELALICATIRCWVDTAVRDDAMPPGCEASSIVASRGRNRLSQPSGQKRCGSWSCSRCPQHLCSN